MLQGVGSVSRGRRNVMRRAREGAEVKQGISKWYSVMEGHIIAKGGMAARVMGHDFIVC